MADEKVGLALLDMDEDCDLTLTDVAMGSGALHVDHETRVATLVFGPVAATYASLKTPMERAIYRGMMSAFGFMQTYEDAHEADGNHGDDGADDGD